MEPASRRRKELSEGVRSCPPLKAPPRMEGSKSKLRVDKAKKAVCQVLSGREKKK